MPRWMWWLSVAVGLAFGILVYAVLTTGVRITTILVAPGGDWTLTVDSPQGGGVATVTTDGVHSFHLTDDADAAGHRITNVAAGSGAGDALVDGQMVNNAQIVGSYPALQLARPISTGEVDLPSGPLAAGACVEVPQGVIGVPLGSVATAMPTTPLEAGAVIEARVIDINLVGVRVCAVTPLTLGVHSATIAVVQ